MAQRTKIILLCLTLLFYLPVNFSASGLPLKQWFSAAVGGAEIPVCGCEDESCCCGAPCCAPNTEEAPAASCCGSESSPTPAQSQWKAACTCGQSHETGALVLVDPHFPAQGDPSAQVLFQSTSAQLLVMDWSSRCPSPPDHVPKVVSYINAII